MSEPVPRFPNGDRKYPSHIELEKQGWIRGDYLDRPCNSTVVNRASGGDERQLGQEGGRFSINAPLKSTQKRASRRAGHVEYNCETNSLLRFPQVIHFAGDVGFAFPPFKLQIRVRFPVALPFSPTADSF